MAIPFKMWIYELVLASFQSILSTLKKISIYEFSFIIHSTFFLQKTNLKYIGQLFHFDIKYTVFVLTSAKLLTEYHHKSYSDIWTKYFYEKNNAMQNKTLPNNFKYRFCIFYFIKDLNIDMFINSLSYFIIYVVSKLDPVYNWLLA